MAPKRIAAVNRKSCVACGTCEKGCPITAIKVFKGSFAKVIKERCVGCGKCVKVCPANSIVLESRVTV